MKRTLAALALVFSGTAANAKVLEHKFCSERHGVEVTGTFSVKAKEAVTPEIDAMIDAEVDARTTEINNLLERYDDAFALKDSDKLSVVAQEFIKTSETIGAEVNATIGRSIEFENGEAELVSVGRRCTPAPKI